MNLAHGVPFKRHSPDTLLRLALVHAVSAITNRALDHVARERFGEKDAVFSMVRAATGAADTDTAGWAAELSGEDVQAFIAALVPVSAYAALAARALAVDFGTAGSVRVPFDGGTGTELAGAWVGQNGVIPAKRGTLGEVTLRRFKMGVIVPLTEEVARSSPANAEQFMQRMMSKHTARALDGHFFSTNAAVAGIRPAGIVNGVVPIAASATGSVIDKAITDLSALVTAVVNSGNGDRIVLVMNTAQRTALATMRDASGWLFRDELARGQLMGVEMVSSGTVPAGNVYAIDCDNLATGLGVPELDASREATFVPANADTIAPTHATAAADRTAIGVAEQVPPDGGLSVFDAAQHAAGKAGAGAGALSMFQQWAIALRMILPISWGIMRPGSVQWVSGAVW